MLVSVIIPVYNGGDQLRRCLHAVQETHYQPYELIVVDDGSTDGSAAIATAAGARVIVGQPARSGPAHARNQGAAEARGELLFFVDADVMIRPGTIGHAVATMQAHPELAACFGSYDDTPSETNFLSQYRNLLHHYVHQISKREASTFWSGCGMIRRELFLQMGGFRTLTPGRPSIEDVELGYRLRAAGHDIYLEKLLLASHMKRWTLWNMLVTDVRDRAWPWTRLIVQAGSLPNDLNLQTSQRLSTAVAFLLLFALLLLPIRPFIGGAFLLIGLPLLIILNRGFYQFLRERQGGLFTVRAVFFHWLYFLYSGATFAVGVLLFNLRSSRAGSSA